MKILGQETSSSIIAKTNTLLDNIKKPTSIKETKKNILELSKLRDEMLRFSFNTSFPEMLISSSAVDIENKAENKADFVKQLKLFREFANLKRYTFNRLKVSLAANRILYNMYKRKKLSKVSDYLPYNGGYLAQIIHYGEPALRAYTNLMGIMKRKFGSENDEGRYVITLISDNKKISLKVHSKEKIEEKIKEKYGEGVIIDIKKEKSQPFLVRKKSNRVAIAAAYATMASEKTNKIIMNDLKCTTDISGTISSSTTDSPDNDNSNKDNLNNDNTNNSLFKLYASLLKERGFSEDTRIDLLEGHENFKDLLYSKGLLINEKEELILSQEVSQKLSKKRRYYNKLVVDEAVNNFSWDIFYYFMTQPKRIRASSPLFHGLSTYINAYVNDYINEKQSDINEKQLEECFKIFDFLKIQGISNPIKMIKKKLKIEPFVNVPGDILGAVILNMSGKSLDWCSSTFAVDAQKVAETVKRISYLSTKDKVLKGKNGKISDRAKKFLKVLEEDKDI